MRPHTSLLLGLSVLIIISGGCGAPAPQVDPSAQIDALVDEYLGLRGQRGSDWSTEALSQSGAPDFSPERFAERLQPQRDLLARLQAVEPDGLTLPEQTDRQVMIALLESDLYNSERRRAWEMQPLLYVPVRQVSGLFAAARSGGPGAAGEAAADQVDQERATILLGAVPAALEQGRSSLGRPSERATREAIYQTAATIEVLRNGLPTLTALSDEVAAAGAEALAALESYLEFLETDLLARSDGSWAIGREHYDYTLEHRWLMDEDADDIIAIGREVFERTVAEAQEVAERIAPGKHWVEVYEELKKDHPTAEGLKQAYQEQMDAAKAFVIEQKILTLPAGEEVITVDTPPAQRRSSPFGTFDSVGPEDDDLLGRLVLTPIEEGLTPEQHEARLSAHHTAWVPIIAVHEAYPGHHSHALKMYENPRKLRHYVNEAIFSEGWGLFTEQLMFEEGFLQGDDVKLTQLRNRLWRAARVILDASLHTGQMTFDEAVDFMVEEIRFDRVAAELEVGMYTERPTYFLGYLIGMVKIEQMREEWIAKYGEPEEPRELYDVLLTIGALPPTLVRAELLAR
jgi:uncharacterized protein (DUF885 family)